MTYNYFPGCTLATKAAGYDVSGRAVAEALEMTLEELPEWQCCGATFPLATDNSMALIAPTRMLAQMKKAGGHTTTLCAICYLEEVVLIIFKLLFEIILRLLLEIFTKKLKLFEYILEKLNNWIHRITSLTSCELV